MSILHKKLYSVGKYFEKDYSPPFAFGVSRITPLKIPI